MTIPGNKGKPPTTINEDDGLKKVRHNILITEAFQFNLLFWSFSLFVKSVLIACQQFDPAKLKKLPPSFKKNEGTVTAGNASLIR